MRRRIARFTSSILNPFLVSLGVVIFLSFESASSTAEGIKWALIVIGMTLLPVLLVIIYLVHTEKLDDIFIKSREQRNKIYLLASVCALASCLILVFLGAPLVLVATLVSGLSAVIVFMVINLSWKISTHTAFAAGSAAVLTIMYGSIGALFAMIVPPIAWSRIELRCHSPAQTLAGALLSALIVFAVFHFFGLIGAATTL